MEKINRLIFSFLLAVTVLAGCATQKYDRMAGWTVVDFNQQPDQAIVKDYHNYAQKLPPEEKIDRTNPMFSKAGFLEDGTGRHAVIMVSANETWEQHILIYDKNNKRTKVIVRKLRAQD
jgi:hypothetical protein